MSTQRRITLVEESDGWTAIDEATGLECSGEERDRVLARLDDAAAVSFDDDPVDDAANENPDGEADEPELDWFEV